MKKRLIDFLEFKFHLYRNAALKDLFHIEQRGAYQEDPRDLM